MKKLILVLIILIGGFFTYRYFFPGEYPIINARPSGEQIICFGDSLTYGIGAKPGRDYPSRLSELVGQPVINAGVPGDTTADGLARLETDVLSRSPRIVLITLGGNDLKNGVPKKKAFANLGRIVKTIQQHGALVVLGGVDFPFWGKGFGEAYKTLAREQGTLLVPNVLEGLLGNPKRMSDTIHPNSKGYRIMARRFYQLIAPYLSPVSG